MVDIECPVPDCDFKPPENLSDQAQIKSLERHVNLRHTLDELPKVVDGIKAMTTPEQPKQPEVKPEPEKPKESIKVENREPRVNNKEEPKKATVTALPGAGSGDSKNDRIEDHARQWGNWLYQDFNPLLVANVARFADIPDPWLKGGPANGQPLTIQTPDGKVVTFWQPSLEEQLALSEKEAKRLAKAAAVFAESDMGKVMVAFLEANAHWVALGAALWVAGTYGWKVMRIRTEVAQLKEVIKQQMDMQQPQPASNNGPEEASAA